MDFKTQINSLKKEKNAVILAHYYTIPEVQEIADCLGDSLVLAQYAQKTNADMIIFAGVDFMAETAKILNEDKRVFVPDNNSHCTLSIDCPAEEFKKYKEENPGYKVISYINCSTEIKILSDVICTSSNAERIVESFLQDEKLIFAPDKNLGNYLNKKLKRNMLLWHGRCNVHDRLNEEDYFAAKKKYKNAVLIIHPECNEKLVGHADFVGSTTELINYVGKTDYQEYIIATEEGILHEMQKKYPDKNLHILESSKFGCTCCDYMKLNNLEKIYNCIKNESNEILLAHEKIEAAKKPILRMLSLS